MVQTTRFRLALGLSATEIHDMAKVRNTVQAVLDNDITDTAWKLLDDETRRDVEDLVKASGGQARMALSIEEGRLVLSDALGTASLDYVAAYLQTMQRRLEIDAPWTFTYSLEDDQGFGGGLIAVRGDRVIRQDIRILREAAQMALQLPSPQLAHEDVEPAGWPDKAAARAAEVRAMDAAGRVLAPFATAGGPLFIREAQDQLEMYAGARVSAVSLSPAGMAFQPGDVPLARAHVEIREAAAYSRPCYEAAFEDLLTTAQANFPSECFTAPEPAEP